MNVITQRGVTRLQIVFAGLFLIVCGALLYFNRSQERISFPDSARSAATAFDARDFSTAIDMSAKAVEAAPTSREAHQAQLLQARALFSRSGGNDITEAIGIIKSIVTSPDATPLIKAASYTVLAREFFVTSTVNRDLYSISDQDPFREIVAKAGIDKEKIAIALLEKANSLQETVYVDYALAELRVRFLYRSSINPTDASQKNEATVIRALLTSGDAILERLGPSSMSDIQLFELYSYRAQVLSVISPFFSDITNDMVNKAYETAMSSPQSATSPPTFFLQQRVEFLFLYALSLQDREPATQSEKIRALLGQFAAEAPKYPGIASYIQGLQSRADTDPAKRGLAQLVKRSPEFAAYVKGVAL